MQLLEHADQPLLVDLALLRRQRLAGSQLFEHVVHVGQGELGVLGLLALAVRIQFLGDAADAVLLRVGGGGEGKRLKRCCSIVARCRTQSATGLQSPNAV